MQETLTEVDERTRADDHLFLRQTGWDEGFQLEAWDDTFSCFFDDVDVFIEVGEEWATFYSDDVEVFSISTAEDSFIDWPHWLFEELDSISHTGELRPEGDYEESYNLTEMARNAA